MPMITADDLTKRINARTIYASFIVNDREVTNKLHIDRVHFIESDRVIKDVGAVYTTYEEQQAILYESPAFQLIINGNKSVTGSTSGLTQIDFSEIYDTESNTTDGVVDDAYIPIPMGGIVFNFFGTNYTSDIWWNSNNALIFQDPVSRVNGIVSISATTAKSILLGNYDRLCSGLYYSNTISSSYSITKLVVQFTDYYLDNPASSIYIYEIRLIKETTGAQRQFVEVSVVSSPPSPGYSSAAITYPSGSDGNGNPMDTNGNAIDQTKASPYNITDGVAFLNPCGTTFSTESPPAGTSFLFSSDSTGTTWTFTNNAYVNV